VSEITARSNYYGCSIEIGRRNAQQIPTSSALYDLMQQEEETPNFNHLNLKRVAVAKWELAAMREKS